MTESVEVLEAGGALKVHTDTPHLVSLGGGRFSTAVTLHPLPQGRVSLGSDPNMDIVVQGTGVEPIHCHIENTGGMVMLYPQGDMTSIDGMKVSGPTRLTQGGMICIGRSNYFRFNHPAEARLMKSIMPNTRISMAPLNFSTDNGESYSHGQLLDKKPPMVPKRSPRDSWGDVSNSSSCNSGSEECCVLGKVSKFEYLAQNQNRNYSSQSRVISPKVFPSGCTTVNSPASAVLGSHHSSPTHLVNGSPKINHSPSPGALSISNTGNVRSRSGTPVNGMTGISQNICSSINGHPNRSSNSTPVPSVQQYQSPPVFKPTVTSVGSPRSISSSPAFDINNRSTSSVSSTSSKLGQYENILLGKETNSPERRGITTPSPAFNRNPSYHTPGFRSVTPNPVPSSSAFVSTGPRSVTPSPPKAISAAQMSSITGHKRAMSAGSDLNHGFDALRRVASPTPSFGSNCSLEELSARKEELEQKRKQAQQERLKEQEIEKQERARLEEILTLCAEYEKQVQNEKQKPTTPTIQQNRIKTNGSLPRDKRLQTSCFTAEEQRMDIFTFDVNASKAYSTPIDSTKSPNYNQNSLSTPNHSLQHSNGPSSHNSSVKCSPNTAFSPYENIIVNSPGTLVYPQSPRTRIRTIAITKEQSSIHEVPEGVDVHMSISNDYDFISSRHQLQASQDVKKNMKESVCEVESNIKTSEATTVSTKKLVERDKSKDKFILPLENGSSPEMENIPKNNIKQCNGTVSGINMVNGSTEPKSNVNELNAKGLGNKKFERKKADKEEADGLRKERSKILAAMSGIKRNITEVEQQEEELLRELEMERALLDGEWQAQNDKLKQEEIWLSKLQENLARMDYEMENWRKEENIKQVECQLRADTAEMELRQTEKELSSCTNEIDRRELSEKLKLQIELVEAERKAFEDIEFQQLEQEATVLSQREEVQRDATTALGRVEARKIRLKELQQQRVEAAQAAQQESLVLERHRASLLRRLEESRSRLRTIELNIEELLMDGRISGQDSSPDGSSDMEELTTSVSRISTHSIHSQEDLDRISRVTMGAPMDVNTGSLGRKTIASLQEIERNRQIHLVQQGAFVIEEERKRVEELKRRVQDEVRAQWEERRQREANCNSLNSVGSDETSLTSSDILTESASSDDALEKRMHQPVTPSVVDGQGDKKEKTDEKKEEKPSVSEEQTEASAADSADSLKSVRQKELELQRDAEETRPLSDGSSYEHHLDVRMREKAAKLKQRPLTRYLPIRSESLNLRHHIESAGHQIELCPYVTVDSTSCRGHLHKMGSKFHHWNKRWFVFDRSRRTLTYYSDRSEKKPRGGAYFQAIEEVYVDHLNSVKSPSPHLTFVVKTNERTYYLMAPSAEAMRIWVDVIFTGAEGYQEFEHGS